VEARTTTDRIEVRGTVQPLANRDVQVAPQASGRLLAVKVREGDAVTLGQEVARIDDGPLIDSVRQAEAGVARARADRENAETTLVRVQRVYERGIAPKQEADDAVARSAAARAAEAEAEATARQARRQLDRAVVKAPLAGVVLKVWKRPGELVDGTTATAVLEIADVSSLELVADVPAQDLVRLRRDAVATVDFPPIPPLHATGTVSLVSPTVDRVTGVGAVRIALAPSSTSPPVGVYGIGRIDTGGTRAALFVPGVAVRASIGRDGEIVACGTDGRAHVKKVRLGSTEGASVELVEGLGANDRVAIEPVLGLAEGDPLEEVR